MKRVPIGVANSVSANFDFDPLDTLEFATQKQFETAQIYLNENLIRDIPLLEKIKQFEAKFQRVYFHAHGFLSPQAVHSPYFQQLHQFLTTTTYPNYIIHFDETIPVDQLIQTLENHPPEPIRIYLENYFSSSGKDNVQKNLKKYMAIFTLLTARRHYLFPVLDIPRLFHRECGFSQQEALNWCFQLLNFFSQKGYSILLHLVDFADDSQQHHQFRALGEGYIPYDRIFEFIRKTSPLLEGIILEYQDKLNTLKSADFIRQYFQE
ncbi:MAG: hypothetical protein GXO78_05535 [Calditrichaeota bacterium]|nr:hypothetical protein [Calditrichota bacterium]